MVAISRWINQQRQGKYRYRTIFRRKGTQLSSMQTTATLCHDKNRKDRKFNFIYNPWEICKGAQAKYDITAAGSSYKLQSTSRSRWGKIQYTCTWDKNNWSVELMAGMHVLWFIRWNSFISVHPIWLKRDCMFCDLIEAFVGIGIFTYRWLGNWVSKQYCEQSK